MLSKLFLLPRPLLLSIFLQGCAGVLADSPPFFNDQKFESGEFGSYPVQSFHSSTVVAPHVNILSKHSSCDDGSLTMLNPRGYSVPEEARGPMILDSMGHLVWAVTGYEQTYDLMVQEYLGEQYLTFWSGDDAVGGHGAGHYVMINKHYHEVRQISAANGMAADLHEFRFTDAGTALITVYDIREADLTSMGKTSNGYIWDSLFQEIDIGTGELLFQWRASDHFAMSDSYHAIGDQGNRSDPWDFFHINSVEKDPWGNYLISSRHTHTVSFINGTTGEVIWILGGRRNDFKDLSDGRATDFASQHDARWHDNYTAISIFNNGAEAPDRIENSPFSRAMKIRVDTKNGTNMTAELVAQYINSQQISSSSQGSMQILPNGNVLVGYGYNAAYTEFAPNGVALCDTHFGAASSFHSGDVQSYRVLKSNWTGAPTTRPNMSIVDDMAYVSWNGATEVHQWIVQTGEFPQGEDETWQPIINTKQSGFETPIKLTRELGSYVRIAAVDNEGKILGTTASVLYDQRTLIGGLRLHSADTKPLVFLICCMGLVSFTLCVAWSVTLARKCRRRGQYLKIPDEAVPGSTVDIKDEVMDLIRQSILHDSDGWRRAAGCHSGEDQKHPQEV